jgi:PAS domain S-box-containing protein
MKLSNEAIEKFFFHINQLTEQNYESYERYTEDFSDYPQIVMFFESFKKKLNTKTYSRKQIEKFIDDANSILLKFAQNIYSDSIDLTGDDILDSLITSLFFLGEELNYSTVTTHYLMDIFNSIGDLLLVVDERGYILFISDTTSKMLGYIPQEIKSQNINMILETGITFDYIIKNKRTQLNYTFVTKTLDRIPVELKLSDFARPDNPFMGQVIIARDISVPLKYQQEIESQNRLIKKANEELREALKIAEKSEKLKTSFLANMSHEIRTPLNGIMGFSEYIQRPSLTAADYKKFGAIIFDCSQQLLGIVNDVLDISRIESGLMSVSSEPVMINKLLDNLLEIYAQKITSENKEILIELVKPFKDDESYILSDELRLRQILSNLLDNAVKYTDEGRITFGYNIKNQDLEFYIIDTGIGIHEEKQPDIFKPFHQAIETTTKLYGGTGLGLAIAKGLTNLLDGNIYFKSEIGKGSKFSFTLPYMKSVSTIASEIDEHLDSFMQWKGKTLVIVEDDMHSIKYLETILRDTGATLRFFDHGRDAINFLRSEDNIDVVLMDIRLPDIDGITATKLIREFNTRVPIIAQTAYASNEDKLKCLRSGCNYHVPKPINRNQLISVIDAIIRKK